MKQIRINLALFFQIKCEGGVTKSGTNLVVIGLISPKGLFATRQNTVT